MDTFLFPWFTPLCDRLRERFASEARDGAHDLSHALRVARNAETLARAEGADVETCVAAALLHDLAYLPKNHPQSSHTAQLSADEAPAWCHPFPALAAKSETIAQAIATHSYSAGLPPTSLEGAVMQDADRLEAIGAIGLARVFATGGAMGATLWNAEDPWALHRPLDDKRHSLDHFPMKLLKLAATLNTPSGRALAQERHRVLTFFLEALKKELA